jgi:hypothetical protein
VFCFVLFLHLLGVTSFVWTSLPRVLSWMNCLFCALSNVSEVIEFAQQEQQLHNTNIHFIVFIKNKHVRRGKKRRSEKSRESLLWQGVDPVSSGLI